MADILKPLGLALLMAVASPAIAQDSGATSDTAEAPAADAQLPEVDMGTPADQPAQPQQLETYVSDTFGDWERECLRMPEGQEGPDPCQLTQILRETPEANPIGKITVGVLPAGQQAVAGSTVIMPLGTLLTQQLTLGVDSGAAKRYPFRFCQPAGCVAQIGFTAEEVASFKAGSLAHIKISPVAQPDAVIDVPVSLKGFTDAWNSLQTTRAHRSFIEHPSGLPSQLPRTAGWYAKTRLYHILR
ncbi:MAG: invasion associated locus B family protein, partial [Maritimibacter sp.]